MRLLTPAILAAALVAACSHTDPAGPIERPTEGPFGTVSPIRLTFSTFDDAAPTFSANGGLIAYSFGPPGTTSRDRCLGLLPGAGGTRILERCDTRATHLDSVDALTPVGIDPSGRLFYTQSSSGRIGLLPGFATLMRSDTTPEAAATPLLALPFQVAAGAVTWLANGEWVNDDLLVAVGLQMTVVPRCGQCGAQRDTIFNPVSLVRLALTAGGATATGIPGTEGAVGFGMNAARTEIVFATATDFRRIPLAGGTPAIVAAAPAGATVVDMDCGADRCVALLSEFPGPPGRAARIGNALVSFPFGGSTLSPLLDSQYQWWGVSASPTGGDVVVVTTAANGSRDLFLYRGLLQ